MVAARQTAASALAKLRKVEAIERDFRADPETRKVAGAKARELREKLAAVLHPIAIQLERPRAGSPGKILEAQWAQVGDDEVQLYSTEGKSLGHKHRRKIVPPNNARETAAITLRMMARAKDSSFSRTLVYPRGF